MWKSISHAFTNFGQKKESAKTNQPYIDSDDDTCSNTSTEEGLECPICWESFNIVENIPYVLLCGHTLCKNCVLGLHWATLKIYNQQIQIPFFICCPWCNLFSFRLVYKGNLRFPSKNFFLLWMVESRNGDRIKSPPVHTRGEIQTVSGTHSYRVQIERERERNHLSLTKSLDLFIRVTSKIPFVFLLLVFVICVLPSSVAVLVVYLIITILFAIPSFLVLYFAYPALNWLVKEITT